MSRYLPNPRGLLLSLHSPPNCRHVINAVPGRRLKDLFPWLGSSFSAAVLSKFRMAPNHASDHIIYRSPGLSSSIRKRQIQVIATRGYSYVLTQVTLDTILIVTGPLSRGNMH